MPAAQPILKDSAAIRRFDIPDLMPWGNWLVGRLRKRFPQVNDRTLIGWLQGVIYSPEYMFLRSENAIGLMQMSHRPMDPAPIVEEIFVLAKDGFAEEAALLYPEFRRWAETLGAAEMQIERFTDVPRETIKGLGRVFLRETAFVRIPRAVL